MPTLVARTGTCARPEFWRSQRSRAHKPPPQPDASPDADPQMHVWSVRYGRCACAKPSSKKVRPRHPPGCLVLNPRDPGRAVWQYPRITTCLFSVSRVATNMRLEDLSAHSATCDLKIVRRSGDNSGTTGSGLFTLSSKPLLAYAFRWIRKIHTHRCQGDSTQKKQIRVKQ